MSDENTRETIMLDGTYGPGTMSKVVVFTRIPDSDQIREEEFTIPYLFLDLGKIATMQAMNLFAGFQIINLTKQKPSGLKELGL
jgi:hypothetical protein